VKEFELIRDLYNPIQPSVPLDDDRIIYKEIQASKEVRDFVHCFWQLKTISPLESPYSYRIVSDGCIDIFFEKDHPKQSFIMGFFRKYTSFSIGKKFNYIGIRFLPTALPLLFKINANELSNQSQKLSKILPKFSQRISKINTKNHSFDELAAELNEIINQHIQKETFELDPRLFNSLNIIFQTKGNLDIEKDLNTGLSPRQLRRIFNFYLGTTPKAFSNVVRFQYILNLKPSSKNLKENKLYYDVGFFDQAHFIKNFKTFYGVTPSEALS